MIEHHALGKQVGKGFVVTDQAEVAHHLGPEARVEQVQDGVLDAADVLVHRHPVGGLCVDHRGFGKFAGVARVVPGRVHEGVHGVGFTPRRLAALRARRGEKIKALVQRIAGAVRDAVFGQLDRQLVVGHGYRAAAVAVDDRDRAAPVALTRDSPVAQAVLHLLVAQAFGIQVGGNGIDGCFVAQPIVLAGIDAGALLFVGVPLLPGSNGKGLCFHGNHLLDGQLVL